MMSKKITMSESASRSLSTVGETTLARYIRTATVPVMILFRSSQCSACAALRPMLASFATRYSDQLLIISVDVDRTPLVAEHYGVAAVPTLLVLRDGEELTRLVGFVPKALLQVFFDDLLAGELLPSLAWHPVEQVFEDTVIIPLLDAWGWRYGRQVVCPRPADRSVVRGRVDIMVYDSANGEPLTLFEAKRQIAHPSALQQAAVQAHRYAEAFHLPSFVVAAPSGMWLYRRERGQAQLLQAFSSLEIVSQPTRIKTMLSQLSTLL